MKARRQRKKNPAELVLMGANPLRVVNSHFSDDEKMALGRLGISWKAIQTSGDVRKARKALSDAAKIRKRFRNPLGTSLPIAEQREKALEIYSGFHAAPPEERIVMEDEPHVPAGVYPGLGLLVSISFKPTSAAQDQYEKNYISEKENVHVIGTLERDQIYFADGDQQIPAHVLRYFGWNGSDGMLHLGAAREIRYLAKKYHPEVPESARGEIVEWFHKLGEVSGEKPELWYDVTLKRIFLRHGAYEIKDEGIVN